jgi:hypothetical protein
VTTRLLVAFAATLAAVTITAGVPSAQSPPGPPASTNEQSDLDAFMKQVLSRRDDNWKKLQQYTLEEDEIFQVTALSGRKVYGFRREYSWFPNDNGVFVRSPISSDGVRVPEEDRRKAEANWIKEEEGREKREQQRARKTADGQEDASTSTAITVDKNEEKVDVTVDSEKPLPGLDDLVKPNAEPRFVSSAYFMKFKFDEGSYAFAGREKLLGRDVYKIEYYPHQYFRDTPEKRERERTRRQAQGKKDNGDIDDKIERKMDKVSMITLWIEPKDHQILQYQFSNIDFDFLPGRALVRLDDLNAAMRMREAFPDVWLPDTITMAFGMTIALGDISASYDVKYHDYKLAEVKARVR